MEPPYRLEGARPLPDGFLATMAELTSAGHRADAISYFMTAAVGLPEQAVEGARRSPGWAGMEAVSHTLLYDSIIVGEGAVPSHLLGTITAPTLCIDSTGSPDWLRAGRRPSPASSPGRFSEPWRAASTTPRPPFWAPPWPSSSSGARTDREHLGGGFRGGRDPAP